MLNIITQCVLCCFFFIQIFVRLSDPIPQQQKGKLIGKFTNHQRPRCQAQLDTIEFQEDDERCRLADKVNSYKLLQLDAVNCHKNWHGFAMTALDENDEPPPPLWRSSQ